MLFPVVFCAHVINDACLINGCSDSFIRLTFRGEVLNGGFGLVLDGTEVFFLCIGFSSTEQLCYILLTSLVLISHCMNSFCSIRLQFSCHITLRIV